MQIIATGKNLRTSPQKARLVVAQIKKMSPLDAVRTLEFVPNKSSNLIKKVIDSAIANAKNNSGLAPESLSFKEIQVGKGIMFKRYRPISRGRAHKIHQTTSHVRVILEGDKEAKKVAQIAKGSEVAKQTEVAKESKAEEKVTKKEEPSGTKS